jgi:hypothetical protein
MLRKIFTLVAVVLTAFSALSSRPTQKFDNWTLHPSFDNLPRRIVDTPNKVYFFVHQRIFKKTDYFETIFSLPQYSVPSGAVFTLDKNNPSAPMANINNLAPLSGSDMVNFEVDPISGIMVFAYLDGGVDIVTPDYMVKYFDTLKRRNFPGSSNIRNISFDKANASVRISADSGYIEISTESLQLIRNASWTKPVLDIISYPGGYAAIIDSTVCTAPADANPLRMNAFEQIPDIASKFSGTPTRLMSLSDKTLGVVTNSGQIVFLTRDDNNAWTFQEKVTADNNIRLADAYYICTLIEQTVIPSKDGFYVSTPSKAHLIKRANGEATPEVTTIALPSGSTRYSASYDGSNFWFYRERGKFHSASYTDAKWSALSEPIRPDAPLPGSECAYTYIPGHGFMASSERGSSVSAVANPTYNKRYPVLLSLYTGGKWQNLSPIYNLPDRYNTDTNLRNNINNNPYSWPLCEVTGTHLDPLFPNYLHMGSSWGGMAAIDYTDLSKMPVMTTVPNYTFAPWAAKQLPQQSWNFVATAYCAGFDADNNLWCVSGQNWNKTSPYNSQTYVLLSYLTPEGRRDALEAGDPSKLQWKHFYVDQGHKPNFYNNAIVLTHPSNRGKILWFTEGDGNTRYITIYDTKQTLDNQADDSFVHFNKVLPPHGAELMFNNLNQAIEDPVSGQIYLFTNKGAFLLNPQDHMKGAAFPVKEFSICDAEGMPMEIYSPMNCTRATLDEYGRLWIGTAEGGVLGISTSDHRLVARYDMDNSPLPSNKIRGIGWNPDTKSLFITTIQGMAEVRPDVNTSTGSPSPLVPFLSASWVNFNFTGTVAVYNAPANANLSVTDKAGNTIAMLPAPVKGVTHWNLISASGKRVPAGLYFIRDNSQSSGFPSLTLTVK